MCAEYKDHLGVIEHNHVGQIEMMGHTHRAPTDTYGRKFPQGSSRTGSGHITVTANGLGVEWSTEPGCVVQGSRTSGMAFSEALHPGL
jgi:hypothetical protein